MPSSMARSAPAENASLPEVTTTPLTAASAEVCCTISSSSVIVVSSSTFIERPGMSHAEFVDDDGVFLAVIFRQDAVEEGGLAGAEIAGQHGHGNLLRRQFW